MAVPVGTLLRLASIAEVTAGTTPATPAFATMRVTKASGGIRKMTSDSEEMTGDPNLREVIYEGFTVEPSYDFQLNYGSLDTYLESLFRGTWATNVLKNGTTAKSISIEEADLGGSSTFARYTGAQVQEMSLRLEAQKKITGSMKLVGLAEAAASTAISGATYTAASVTPALVAGTGFGAFTISGLSAQPRIKSLDLTISQPLDNVVALGSMGPVDFAPGQISVKGSLVAYFESIELYALAMSHGGGAITFQIGTTAGSKYQVDLPAVTLVQPERQDRAVKGPIMQKIDFTAVRDATLGATIKLTRAV
jgi:hypothetical protein